ncbi:MAG: hypothetical protein FWD61_17010 [Phycisphaerales bacterium]|nr:hypothetical protein [Phycisphaerales bacterium]
MSPSTPNFDELIPELKEWNDGKGISIDTWLEVYGNFQLTIAYRQLFWPDFVEHDNCVLVAPFSSKTYEDFFRHTNGDRAAVEAVMNHHHILDLFSESKQTATEAQMRYIGRTLQEIWTAKLKRDFPHRMFAVSFNDIPGLDLVDYQITFSQRAS